MVALIALTPLHLRLVYGISAADAAVFLMAMAIGLAAGSILTGQLVSRTGRSAVFPSLGLSVLVPVLVTFALVGGRPGAAPALLWYGAMSFCFGTVMGVLQISIQVAAGPAQLGAAAAFLQMSRTLGAATGVSATMAVVLAVAGSAGVDIRELARTIGREATTIEPGVSAGFTAAFLCIATFALVGAVFAWRLPSRRV